MSRLILALGLILVLALGGCGNERPSLTLGFPPVDQDKKVAAAIAEVLQGAGIDVTVEEPSESAEELAVDVEGGAIDLAILEEPLRHNKNLTMLMPVLPRVLHVLYHESMGTPTLHELLQAESIYAGQPNGQGHTIIKALAAHHQLPDLPSRLLSSPWVPAPGGPPQVYFIFGGLLSAEARLGFANYKMFSFDASSGSSPEALALLFPNVQPFTLPRGIYPELANEPIATLAVETLLVARRGFDSEYAYQIVQALFENSQPIKGAYALSRNSFLQPLADETHTLSMHDGSRRYVNKDEPSLLERYAEVFALLVAVSLALVTGLTTWLRSRRQRRKDRLDEYFLRLHHLRAHLKQPDETPELQDQRVAAARANVAALEAEVLQLLVAERLSVDSALVSFFLMSESVRRESAAAAKTIGAPARTDARVDT